MNLGGEEVRVLVTQPVFECSVKLDDKQETPGEVHLQLHWRPEEPDAAEAVPEQIAVAIWDGASRLVSQWTTGLAKFLSEPPLLLTRRMSWRNVWT